MEVRIFRRISATRCRNASRLMSSEDASARRSFGLAPQYRKKISRSRGRRRFRATARSSRRVTFSSPAFSAPVTPSSVTMIGALVSRVRPRRSRSIVDRRRRRKLGQTSSSVVSVESSAAASMTRACTKSSHARSQDRSPCHWRNAPFNNCQRPGWKTAPGVACLRAKRSAASVRSASSAPTFRISTRSLSSDRGPVALHRAPTARAALRTPTVARRQPESCRTRPDTAAAWFVSRAATMKPPG